jgi:hypothetical protein
MDIHKPKPWRGWPEFLKEIGTIVIGVLIALGAEAVVEKLHEQRLSDEARAAVRAEIGLNLANIQRRAQWQPCIDRRLSEISELLSKAERGEPFEPAETIGSPGAPLITTGRWEAATAGGRTSLLGLDEQRNFAGVYSEFSSVFRQELAEREAWGDIEALEGVARLSPELVARERLALAHARLENWAVRNSLREAVNFAARVGAHPTPNGLLTMGTLADREKLCLPISTTPAEAAKQIRDPLGGY